ncbi:microviridin/marinostatin family tricyclic proteinase inhibitor [Chitinophaga pendula]|uniref:microviridin/marinostatin family tricyclic proteinase inhibitor n=1 Tax=Chitinophaga TaxID=79328 RepID=UPI000BAF445B|nr:MULTISPECIES: microviridin/marinostatin family tricyclic proteinase inhibitor [Chitinophaga]ASZ12350.1 hypothetical protein CK934_15970 [Chitinophaga sp. MD30]UCJ10056.1 microviridin/marinostatin family tricyclic proteinase inhibitor [Chitinophaga pendula]
MKTQVQIEKPFFAQFLETQEHKNEEQLQQAAQLSITNKFLDEPLHTLKYPSDGDESNV